MWLVYQLSYDSLLFHLSLPLPPSLSSPLSPYLNSREAVVVDVILLQHSSPVVVEINTDLFPAVNSVVSQHWVATCGDPHSSQRIGVNLISLDKTSSIVVLHVNKN